jgi:hypothetical protein
VIGVHTPEFSFERTRQETMRSVAFGTRTRGTRACAQKSFGTTGWDTKGIPWMISTTRSKRTFSSAVVPSVPKCTENAEVAVAA